MSVWQGYEFLPMHGFEPLEKYLEDPILLDPEFDVDDFVPKMVNGWCKWNDEAGGTPTFTGVDGTLYLLPGPHDGQVIMCYRTDLLEEYGLDVPETWDDYLEVAKTINNPDEGIYGTTLHGLANEHLMLNDFFERFFTFGGEFLTGSKEDGTLRANLDSPEAIKTLQHMVDCAAYAPPGYLESAIGQTIDQFMTGQCALSINWSLVTGIFESDESAVKGKVGYSTVPGEKEGYAGSTLIGGWGTGINAYSKNKEAAWLWLQYTISKKIKKYSTMNYGLEPVRTSTWEDPEVQEKYPHFEIFLEGYENGQHGPINLAELWELIDIASRTFQQALSGELSVEEACKIANDGWDDVLIREGYLEE